MARSIARTERATAAGQPKGNRRLDRRRPSPESPPSGSSMVPVKTKQKESPQKPRPRKRRAPKPEPATKAVPTGPPFWRRWWDHPRSRAAVLIGGSLTLFFSCWHFAWTAIEDEVRQSETFGFSAERLSVTPKPSWIHEDITREALNSASLDGSVSLMDGDLTERISGAFTLQPWVDRVISVRKHYPGRVEVELEYLGRPIAMVEIPGNLCPGNLEGGLYPIDAAGNLLPTGYFIREARTEASTEYLRLRGIRSLPDGPEGSSWGDPRVRQAGGIAAALEPHRRNLQLTHLLVEPAASGEADPDLTRNRFTLLTRQGNRVVWGTLKENEEIAPEEARKQVDRLLALARKHGSLDGIPDHSVTFASPR